MNPFPRVFATPRLNSETISKSRLAKRFTPAPPIILHNRRPRDAGDDQVASSGIRRQRRSASIDRDPCRAHFRCVELRTTSYALARTSAAYMVGAGEEMSIPHTEPAAWTIDINCAVEM